MTHLGEKESLESLLARHDVHQEIRDSIKVIGFTELFGWHNCLKKEELSRWFLEAIRFSSSEVDHQGKPLDLAKEGSETSVSVPPLLVRFWGTVPVL